MRHARLYLDIILRCAWLMAPIVAMAVGFFCLVEVVPFVLDFLGSIDLVSSLELTRGFILSLAASGFVVLAAYLLGRTIFWGYLTVAVLRVRPKKEDEVKSRRKGTTITFLQQLHVACFDYVREEHKIWAKFYALRVGHWAYLVRSLHCVLHCFPDIII